MPDQISHPAFAVSLAATIQVIQKTLSEAAEYLEHDRHLAALGTLIMFEEQAHDVNAAIRLFRRSLHEGR